LLRESRPWALVDGLAASVVGRLFERHPELGAVLDRCAADSDLWLRPSAMLALLIAIREGRGDFDRVGRTPTPCFTSASSSSVGPSAGYCATRAAGAPPS
jgi:hypothetical protein